VPDNNPLPPINFAARLRRDWFWTLPLLAALLLVAVFCAWLQIADVKDAEESRSTLISDALSAEQQLQARMQLEQERLTELARLVEDGAVTVGSFSNAAAVSSALRQRWLSITWLDGAGRIVKSLPDSLPLDLSDEVERRGRSAHLEAPVRASASHPAGKLVARYSLTMMLNQAVPWWTARRYIVSLVTDFDEVIATTAQPGEHAEGLSHRITFDPPVRDAFIELTQRDRLRPWYQTYPLGLVGLVIALLAWTTWLLRGQIRSVERAEVAWRGEAAWRRSMEDSLTVGLRARDPDGRLIYANPRFLEMTGYEADELIGRDPPMPYWPPDSLEATFSRFRRTISGDAPREGYETRWQRKDGTPIDVMVFEAPLVDERGHHVGWMGSVIDVTERRRALDRERVAAERMAHMARLTSLGEIASSLAHQLNQPLMAISGYNAGLRNMLKASENVDPRVLSALDRQADQAEHAGRIVHRIRDFLMRRAPQPEKADLRRIVDETATLLLGDVRRRGIELDVAHDNDVPTVRVDPILMGQAIVNLVRNAVDASQGLDHVPPRIEIRTHRAGAHGACVEVRDYGPGLQGRDIEQLSSPFYSTKSDGMGLGLAICRTVVEAHAGRLEAEDAADGGGACFRLALPGMEDKDVG
jgi:two-component system, LuxR family, sensor histidine kinase DctS